MNTIKIILSGHHYINHSGNSPIQQAMFYHFTGGVYLFEKERLDVFTEVAKAHGYEVHTVKGEAE